MHFVLNVDSDGVDCFVDGVRVRRDYGFPVSRRGNYDEPCEPRTIQNGLCAGGAALSGAGSAAAIATVATGTQTIAGIVTASADHTTLLGAVNTAGLAATLDGPGNFTLFAPTNAAFAALPEGTLQALYDDISKLTAILTYHALGGVAVASDLSDGLQTTTLQGTDIMVTITADGTFINGAQVTVVDQPATNGVVHIIDAVLLPPDCSSTYVADTDCNMAFPSPRDFGPAAPPPPSRGGGGGGRGRRLQSAAAVAAVAGATQTIAEIVSGSTDHTTLLTAVDAAGLVDTLSGDGTFTLFAPTDAAFAALPEGTVAALLADIPRLYDILTYHAVGAVVMSTDLTDGQTAETLQGADITVTITDGNVFINSGTQNAQVTVVDLPATNGVVHVINAVLLPPDPVYTDNGGVQMYINGREMPQAAFGFPVQRNRGNRQPQVGRPTAATGGGAVLGNRTGGNTGRRLQSAAGGNTGGGGGRRDNRTDACPAGGCAGARAPSGRPTGEATSDWATGNTNAANPDPRYIEQQQQKHDPL